MTPPLYTLERVIRSQGNRIVLDIDHLHIEPSARLVLLGPTGAGKSTLLRLLAGVETPTRGEIFFAGQRLGRPDTPLDLQRRITLVFQKPILLSGTVCFNVEYGLRLRGIRGRAEWVAPLLERLGLTDLAGRSVARLSGGEAQLVALARALAIRPEVLLLDEPSAALDPARVALVEEVIQQFQQETGAYIVWATHNLFQARRLAGRTLLLLEGRLIEDAPAERFFGSPQDPRTAAFVRGEMIY